MNAQRIVDALLGDEDANIDVAEFAEPFLNAPYAWALSAYRRVFRETKDPRKAWAAAIGDGFHKYGHATTMAAFQLEQAVSEIRNLKLNHNPKQVEAYQQHVIGAAVEMLNLPPAKVEAVKMLFKTLAQE